jgi:hypothetical protein
MKGPERIRSSANEATEHEPQQEGRQRPGSKELILLRRAKEISAQLQENGGSSIDETELTECVDGLKAFMKGNREDVAKLLLKDTVFVKDLKDRGLVTPEEVSLGEALKRDVSGIFNRRYGDKRYSLQDRRTASALEDYVSQSITSDDISPNLELADHVLAEYQRRVEQFETLFPILQERFLKRVQPFLAKRYKLTEEEARSRITSVTTKIDFLGGNHGGALDAATREIILDPVFVDGPDLEDIVMHEFMHAFSGSFEHRELIDEGQGAEKALVNVYSGLGQPDGWTWMNEAVTEGEKMLILGQEKGAYSEYRRVLSAIRSAAGKKLDDQVFLAPFMAHKSTEKDKQEAWEGLRDSVDEIFGKGFLEGVDMVITMEGPYQAATAIETEEWQWLQEKGDALSEKWSAFKRAKRIVTSLEHKNNLLQEIEDGSIADEEKTHAAEAFARGLEKFNKALMVFRAANYDYNNRNFDNE